MSVLVAFFICTTLLALSLIRHTNLAGRYLNIVTAFGIVYVIGLIGSWILPAASQKAASEQLETFSAILLTALMLIAVALFAAQELQFTQNTKPQPALAFMQNKVKAPEDPNFPVESLTFRKQAPPAVDECYKLIDPDAKVIRLYGGITDHSGSVFDGACRDAIKGEAKRICILIHTFGGDTNVAASMKDTIRELAKTKDVYILVNGKCWSAGIDVLMAVPVEKRIAAPSSEFMIHAAVKVNGQEADLRINRLNERLISEQSSGSNLDAKALKKLYDSRKDCFLSAEEALERGLIGAIR